MKNKIYIKILCNILLCCFFIGCKISQLPVKQTTIATPTMFLNSADSVNYSMLQWRNIILDTNLVRLIDSALANNQELNIVLREIEISKNEIQARRGEYLPFGNIGIGSGLDRAGKYTFNGMSEEDIKSRTNFPQYRGDQYLISNFSWELDIWKKLHNAKDAAVKRYLSTIEGKNFVMTELVAEITRLYYELVILDNQIELVQQNVALQEEALEIVRSQKNASRVNQLAVNRFEAQLMNTQNLLFNIKQEILVNENKINFLLARYPQPIKRNKAPLESVQFTKLNEGIPSQLLLNRPDIRQAEYLLAAAKLDVKEALLNFFPSLTLRAGLGLQSFSPAYLLDPVSLATGIFGDLTAPLINRKAIKTKYFNANEIQLQAMYKFEQIKLNAFLEVTNQLTGIKNFSESLNKKSNQVDILNNSIIISNDLFKNAKADYTEVLFTQRDALEAKMDLLDIKRQQILARINLYKALGGGWR